MDTHPPSTDDFDLSGAEESPRHGYQGDRGRSAKAPAYPRALTVAVSREAGSRGGSIARRVGQHLGWEVYPQDLLEYLAQDGPQRQELVENLPAEAGLWIDAQLDRLLRAQNLSRNPNILNLARVMLSLAVKGEAVLLGRGAGFVLPARSTLHVRVLAPHPDRVAYMSQYLRLTAEEAAAQVHQRDSKRAEFIATHFHHKPGDIYHYDVLVNSSLLGEELCADLIVEAAKAKQAAMLEQGE